HIVLVGQDHNRVRADEAAMRLQRAEIQRVVGKCRRENAAGRAAGQEALERVAIEQATGIFIDQLADRDAGGRQFHPWFLDAARYRKTAEALVLAPALRGEPFDALLDD